MTAAWAHISAWHTTAHKDALHTVPLIFMGQDGKNLTDMESQVTRQQAPVASVVNTKCVHHLRENVLGHRLVQRVPRGQKVTNQSPTQS